MPSLFRRQTPSDSLAEANAFTSYVDSLGEAARAGKVVVFARLLHLRQFVLFAGNEAGVGVAEGLERAIRAFVNDSHAVAKESLSTFLVVLDAGKLDAFMEHVRTTLGAIDSPHSLEVKVGYCPLEADLDGRTAVEGARFACENIRHTEGVQVRLLDDELRRTFDLRRYVTESLDDAIERGEIRVYAQPIVRVLTGRVCEVESLARWESERFGMIRPDQFVPDLERLRLIHHLDAEVIRLACQQWREAEDLGVAVPFGVNLSRLDFELCDIYQVVRDTMDVYDVPVDQIHIEITESAATGSVDVLRSGVQRFRQAGFKVYMDDFGTGFSSLDGLLTNDYDVVKLDMSLIFDIESNERSRVVVTEAVNMAKRLGMQTLCEGVETIEQLRFLRMIGCEKAQGFFFGRPESHAHAIERLMQEAARYEEEGLTEYLDEVGRVNLIDGSRSSVDGVEAAVFLDGAPVAVVEQYGSVITCLAYNAAFTQFIARFGMSSFEEMVGSISAGSGEMRRRMIVAAAQARRTGQRQDVDFIASGFYSVVGIEFIAETAERRGFLITASSIDSSAGISRERNLEQASPFLMSIYKRIDLFDLAAGTSENLFLGAPLLRNGRSEGILYAEIREFCERNVHPEDQSRFLEFYDLSTLDERVSRHGANHDAAIIRTRVAEGRFEDNMYMLIPMVVGERHLVLSTLRDADVGTHDSYVVSGDALIPDTALLATVLEGADRNIFWKDADRRFLGANQAFLDYYGFRSVDEILGKNDEDLGWHVDEEPFRDDELRVLSGEVVNRARTLCYARNELRLIEATKRPIVVGGRVVGLLGYFHDLGPAGDE